MTNEPILLKNKIKSEKIKRFFYDVMEKKEFTTILGRLLNYFYLLLIFGNIYLIVYIRDYQIVDGTSSFFKYFEPFCIVVFVIEFILRFWVSDLNEKYVNRLHYLSKFFPLVDILSFLPNLIIFSIGFNPVSVIVFRFFLIARLLKLGRYFESLSFLMRGLKNKKKVFSMTIFLTITLLLVSSVIIFVVEHDAQPDKFPDLLTSIYFTGISLATIGYGEIYPITPLGRFITGFMGYCGVLLFALPASIVCSAFLDEYQKEKKSKSLNDKPTLIQKEINNTSSPPPEPKNKNQKFQKYLNYLLESRDSYDTGPRIVSISLIILIVISIVSALIGANDVIYTSLRFILDPMEIVIVIIFTIEYFLRVYMCPFSENPIFRDPIKGRFKYMISPIALVDLLSILPFYLPMVVAFDLRYLRLFRLIRIIRFFKISHKTDSLEDLGFVFQKIKNDMMVFFFSELIVLIFVSILGFYFEHDAQPGKFSTIFLTMWWAIATMTTMGFGDMFPVTLAGRSLAVISGLSGIIMLSIPAGIISSAFLEYFQEKKQRDEEKQVDGIMRNTKNF